MNAATWPIAASHSPGVSCLGWFGAVLVCVFLSQSWPYWRSDRLLPGTHSDGPFHYYNELARLSPAHFPDDLAIAANRNLGAYESFYRGLAWLTRISGRSLMQVNEAVCWLGNALYLGGVMFLLYRLGLPPFACAVGTWIAAQPFVLIGMWTGVVHSLAIPREVWLWPLPWLLAWFMSASRDGAQLLWFYGTLGAVYGFTYPLWAALFGLAFGLADCWRILQSHDYPQFLWLGAAALLCAALVAMPSLATFRAVSRDSSAVLDYNQITRTVYFTKGFRRLLIFAGLGMGAWFWLRHLGTSVLALERLGSVLVASLVVCSLYEPIQRCVPTLSLLYLGRLSLVVYLIAVVLVVFVVSAQLPTWPPWARGLTIVIFCGLCLGPQGVLWKERRGASLAASEAFVRFAETVKLQTPVESLCVIPPEVGSHYFRVFSERGLWIDPKDLGILSRSRATFTNAENRLSLLRRFYTVDTSSRDREGLLERFRSEGVDYVVTRKEFAWASTLSWPSMLDQGGWQLRRPANQTPSSP